MKWTEVRISWSGDSDNECESNDNGDDSSIGSDSESHKHVSELLIDVTV